jgi:hypothetical protein
MAFTYINYIFLLFFCLILLATYLTHKVFPIPNTPDISKIK